MSWIRKGRLLWGKTLNFGVIPKQHRLGASDVQGLKDTQRPDRPASLKAPSRAGRWALHTNKRKGCFRGSTLARVDREGFLEEVAKYGRYCTPGRGSSKCKGPVAEWGFPFQGWLGGLGLEQTERRR